VIQDGHVLIEDGRIAAVGSELAPAIDADEVVSVAGYVVTPGLVNIHHHLYQTHTRAVPIGMRTGRDRRDWIGAAH
jgi:cytosine/adenosine deaminase-related metal-dependent hydrolase